MGSDQNFLTRVASARVGSAIFGLGLGLVNFPKNHNFLKIFGSKNSLHLVRYYPGQRRVGLLFTAGQKYAQVELGPISFKSCPNNIKLC